MKITSYASKLTVDFNTIELRQDFFLSNVFFSINHSFFIIIHFNSWSFFSDLIKSNENFVSILLYHQFHTDQHFNNWFFEIKRKFRQHSFLSSIHTDQIWIFFSWNNPSKTTLYGDFWWFSYRRIFSSIFLHELNFEFHFNSSYQWNEWMINFDHLFIHEIELFEEVNIYDWIITKILKSCI